MIAASKNDEAKKWIPQLFYSFQNLKYIYYVMEYCPGGNLCTMLEYYKKNVPEPMLRYEALEFTSEMSVLKLFTDLLKWFLAYVVGFIWLKWYELFIVYIVSGTSIAISNPIMF